MKIETITYLKEHAITLELNEQLLITKHGIGYRQLSARYSAGFI